MRYVTLFATLCLAAAPLAANAVDGTINFTGKVTDKTCTIQSPQGKDFTVNLPTVSKSTLAGSGQVAGRTPFSINLGQCNPGNVATYFEPGATVASGRLKNQSTTNAATNVDLQLLGSNNLPIAITAAGANSAQQNSQWVAVAADGTANLDYFVEYYATNAATAGEVTSSVKYTIIYN